MWELLVYVALGTGVNLWRERRKRRLPFREWKEAAASLGLHLEETSGSLRGQLRLPAREESIQVRISPSRHSGQGPQIAIVAPWPRGFFHIRLRPAAEKPAEAAGAIEIGEDRFDQAFYVEGPAPLLFALLDAEARRLLIAVPENALRIAHGELRAKAGLASFTETLRLLLDLARHLSQPLDVAQRLARNAREDASSEARLRNLLVLVRELPGETVTREALRAACTDPSPKVRLRAAEVLGADTHSLLLELAASTEDDTAGARAVALLGRELPPERTREILGQALRHSLFKTARACLEALGGSSDPADIDLLAKALMRETGDRLATVVQALEATHSPAAEPPLLAALRHIRTDVRVAAARTLGRIGTAAAVLPLQETAAQTREQDLRRAALQAVAEIQSRLPGASPGQLSLAPPDAGQLSLAETEAGQLSLADAASGQLSIPPESGPPRPV